MTPMPIIELAREHASRHGRPNVSRVDTSVFVRRYFMACMDCSFCHDACCAHGVDVDAPNVERITRHTAALEAYVGVPASAWFTGEWTEDAEHPGGKYTRTRVVGGACVFHNRGGRGCLLHSYCLSAGLDYHELKPMVSALFPLTFDDGILHPSAEASEGGDLVCQGHGTTLYRGVRDELAYYFGPALTAELDALEHATGA